MILRKVVLASWLCLSPLSAVVAGTPGFVFDCSGRADGNYSHPSKCDHYVACVAQKHAYEMSCPLDRDGAPLHYVQNSGPDPTTSRCDYPKFAGCQQQAEVAPETPASTQPAAPVTTTTTKPAN